MESLKNTSTTPPIGLLQHLAFGADLFDVRVCCVIPVDAQMLIARIRGIIMQQAFVLAPFVKRQNRGAHRYATDQICHPFHLFNMSATRAFIKSGARPC